MSLHTCPAGHTTLWAACPACKSQGAEERKAERAARREAAKARAKAQQAAWYQANKDRALEAQRVRRAKMTTEQIERKRAKAAEYMRKHKARNSAVAKAYRARNREAVNARRREYNRKKKAMRANIGALKRILAGLEKDLSKLKPSPGYTGTLKPKGI